MALCPGIQGASSPLPVSARAGSMLAQLVQLPRGTTRGKRALASCYLYFPLGAQPQQQQISMQTHICLDLSPWKSGIAKSCVKKHLGRDTSQLEIQRTTRSTPVFLNLNVLLQKKEKLFFLQDTLLSIPSIWELWISSMVCRGGAQCLFGYAQSWSSEQAEQRRMSQLSVRMSCSTAGRTAGIKLSRIKQQNLSLLTKEMLHSSYTRGSLITCVIPMNSYYIYI